MQIWVFMSVYPNKIETSLSGISDCLYRQFPSLSRAAKECHTPKTQISSKKTQAESRALALILRTHIFEKTSKNYEKIPFHIHGSVRAHFIIDLVHRSIPKS